MNPPRIATPQVSSELSPSDDPLAGPLQLLKMTGVLHCRAWLTAPWGLAIPRIENCMAVHVVNTGSCWLDVAGQPLREVLAGSLVLLPHGTEHTLRSAPDVVPTPLTEIPIELVTERYEKMNFGGGGEPTSISYCGVRCDPMGASKLLKVLPLVIQHNTFDQENEWLRDTARLISREADATRPGSEAVITKLADIIVVQAIRAWLEAAKGKSNWLASLHDRQIGQALAAIHRNPEIKWSISRLANEIGMSRSSLAARFTDLVGQSVMQYVTEWRMQLARHDLLESRQPLIYLAQKYGYQSEAAFSRAFKRVIGISPTQVKAQI